MKYLKLGTIFLLAGIIQAGAAEYRATDTGEYVVEKAGIKVVGATVALPASGLWYVEAQPNGESCLRDVFLAPPDEAYELSKGRRYRQMEQHRKRQDGQRVLRSVYWTARQYARSHDGIAPATTAGITNRFVKGDLLDAFHYIPSVRLLDRRGTNQWENAERTLLAFETKPFIDDGQHWKVWSDGSVRLEAIDPELFAKHGAKLVPGAKPTEEQIASLPKELPYSVTALRLPHAAAGPVDVKIRDARSDATATLRWDPSGPAGGDAALLKKWGNSRVWSWQALDDGEGASLLTYWIHAASKQYGVDVPQREFGRRRRRNRDRRSTMFNMMGGRAAIRETLQLQDIAAAASNAVASVPVTSIEGVAVKSHPFEEMLKGERGGQLDLANYVPTDRFFAYFAAPEALLQLMDGGASFIFESGASVTGRSLQYQVTQGYLKRLGLTESWTRRLLKGGAVQEMAIALPDLFIVDGTDVTVICRLRNPTLAGAALKLLGLSDLSSIVKRPVEGGGASYWTQRGNLLLLSTSRPELERVLKLVQNPGQSLGRSAEFRYVLTRQPIEPDTRAYFYFSDPFIRRLVGPEVKIGQLRRLQARTEMEALTAGALLYKADGHKDAPTVEELVKRRYALQPVVATGTRLDEGGVVHDRTYGTPSRLASLLENPVTQATRAEADAYKNYVTTYNRYWRRFFDPIAIRFDQDGDREMALSIFILPLVDNSLYQGVRQVLIPGEDLHPLPLPELEPTPVATLSLNLQERTWLQIVDGLDDMFERMLGLSPAVLDHLGPDVHLALGDADPIVSMGSGELSSLLGLGSEFDDDMFAMPVLVSMLTRPCALLVGLNDPQAVREEMRRWPTGRMPDGLDGFGTTALYRLADRDAWHYTISIEGVLSFRFGLEVKGRYLVISNLPLSHNPTVNAWREADHNAAGLSLSPGACIKQLPALFTSAAERQRKAAMGGMGCLYPLLLTTESDIDGARERHRELLGHAPLHPGRGEWTWDGEKIQSTEFGSAGEEKQPAFDPDDKQFGVFRGVEGVRLSMQFEGDGLRTRCRWTLKKTE